MPVSASQLREVRSTLKDINLMLEGDPAYDGFVDSLTATIDAFDEMADDRGQLLEPAGPALGSRVKQPEDDAEDEPGAPLPDEDKRPKNFGGSRR